MQTHISGACPVFHPPIILGSVVLDLNLYTDFHTRFVDLTFFFAFLFLELKHLNTQLYTYIQNILFTIV